MGSRLIAVMCGGPAGAPKPQVGTAWHNVLDSVSWAALMRRSRRDSEDDIDRTVHGLSKGSSVPGENGNVVCMRSCLNSSRRVLLCVMLFRENQLLQPVQEPSFWRPLEAGILVSPITSHESSRQMHTSQDSPCVTSSTTSSRIQNLAVLVSVTYVNAVTT